MLFAADEAFSESPLTSLGAVNNLLRLRENGFDLLGRKHGSYDIIKEYNSKYYPRPSRLPPLIEKLVGSLDANSDENRSGNNKKTNAIIFDDKQKDSNANNIISHKGTEKDKITAAMAAAAVASVRAGKKGSFRMETLNNDWDRALRWIAGWDLLRDDNDLLSSYQNGILRGKNKKGFSTSKNKDLFLLKSCMEECIESTSAKRTSRRKTQTKNSSRRKKRASSKVTNKKLRTGPFSRIMTFARSNNVLVTAFCALILSGLKYCTRFISHRSLSHRSNKVYEWLSSMEKDEYDKWSNNFKKQGTKSMGKRGKVKKKAKRQDCTREEQDTNKAVIRKTTETPPGSESETEDREDYIGTHIEFRRIEPRHHSGKNDRKANLKPNDESLTSDDESTEGTVASTKWTVVSKDPSKSSNASCISNLDDTDLFVKNNAPHDQSQNLAQTKYNQDPDLIVRKSNAMQNKLYPQDLKKTKVHMRNNHSKTSSSLVHNMSSASQNLFLQTDDKKYQKSQQVLSPITDPVVHRIPTDEERKEAFNRLREFQMTQIEKVMRKKGLTSDPVDDPNMNQLIETKPITSTNSPTSWSPFRSHGIISFDNPSLDGTSSDNFQRDVMVDSGECLSKTDLILSKLLEEDDEELLEGNLEKNITSSIVVGESWDSHNNSPEAHSSATITLEPRRTDLWGASPMRGSDTDLWGKSM